MLIRGISNLCLDVWSPWCLIPLVPNTSLLSFKQLRQPLFIKIHYDFSIDVERWGDDVSIRPCTHLSLRTWDTIDIHFGEFKPSFFQPLASFAAMGTPGCTVHHDSTAGELFHLLFLGVGSTCFRIDAANLIVEFIDVGGEVDVVDLLKLQRSLFIEDEDRPFGIAFLTEYIELSDDLAMRVKVTEERIGDATQAVGPGDEGRDAVDADTQDLGIQSRKTIQFGLVLRDLTASDWRPGQREEG